MTRKLGARATVGTLVVAALGLAGCGGGGGNGEAAGEELDPLVASHQPTLHALPTVIGLEEGWFEEVGLDVEMQIFDSGAPQIEAGSSGEWSVGALGTVPMLVGASNYDMQMIGMSNDESYANAIYVREDVDISDPAAVLEGSQVLATTISTGEYALRACLDKYGVPADSIDVVNLDQSAVLSSSITGEGDVFQYWAPNTYQAEEIDNQKLLCSGEDAGVMIPGAIIATKEATEDQADEVTRWLAVYMRGMAFMDSNPEEAVNYLRDFYSEQGIELSDESLMKEFETRPLPGVEEQIAWMTGEGDGTAAPVMAEIAQFFVEAGTLEQVPPPEGYINPTFMQEVEAEYADVVAGE